MKTILGLTALVTLLAADAAQALGINCRGSAQCSISPVRGDEAQILSDWIQGVDPNRWYNNGEHIACYHTGICAFLQNTGGTWGSKIKELAPYIPGHDCKVCGSVPYYFPEGNNDVADGQLTFNYVYDHHECTNGLC